MYFYYSYYFIKLEFILFYINKSFYNQNLYTQFIDFISKYKTIWKSEIDRENLNKQLLDKLKLAR